MGARRRAVQLLICLTVGALLLAACGLRQRREAPTATAAPATTAAPLSGGTLAPTAAEPALTATPQPPAPTSTAAEPAIGALSFTTGRNDYVITVDDVTRQFIIYVPPTYDASTATPVVFMFHGSNQGGPLMYENTGWAAKADAENFIVVYPTAWRYPLIGESGLHTKWNSAGLYRLVEPGTELKDDVKFVQAMVATIEATFNVDAGRLYATGFSNGGGFVLSRLVVQMSDVFAAFGTAGAVLAAEAALDTLPTGIPASVYSVVGTQDEKVSEGTGHALPLPFSAEDLAADSLFSDVFATTTTVLSLEPTFTTPAGPPQYTTLIFDQSLTGAGNQFVFRMVNNMGHVYPSGDNNRHGLNVADDFWAFFQLYALAVP